MSHKFHVISKVNKRSVCEYILIFIMSIFYAASICFFCFPHELSFGGSSGFSLVVSEFIPLSPATITAVINLVLMLTGLLILGKQFALHTLFGSTVTTGSIYLLGYIAPDKILPMIPSLFISAIIVGIATALLFSINASSGGTDIIALILKNKVPRLRIGAAMMISDVVIILICASINGIEKSVLSLVGLLIKSIIADIIASLASHMNHAKE